MGGEGKGSRLASGGGIPGTVRREREGLRVQTRCGRITALPWRIGAA